MLNVNYITKTTKDYTYNENGYLVKEVITEEYYEEEIIKSGTVKVDIPFKTAKGVPSPTVYTKPVDVNKPWTITYGPTCGSSLDTSVSSTLSNDDLSANVTNNYTFNVVEGKLDDSTIKKIKKSLDELSLKDLKNKPF